MSRLAIIVSDFHMGARDPLERFAYDNAFAGFCKELADYAKTHDVALTLVLNGDLLDMWTLVDADELTPDAAQTIAANLEYPIAGAGPAKAISRGKAQIDEILAAHPRVAKGLGAVIKSGKARVVYLGGNHDHPIMMPELRAHFRDVVAQIAGLSPDAAQEITFDAAYRDPALRLYVEHGNQFSLDSSYAKYLDPLEADLGLYFLRFVGNRIRALYPEGAESGVLGDIIGWMLSTALHGPQDGTLPLPLEFLTDYFAARKGGLIPDFSKQTLLHQLYGAWNAAGGTLAPPVLLMTALTDVFHSHEEPEFRRSVVASPDDTGFIKNVALRGKRILVDWEGKADRYWKGAASRFSAVDAEFPALDPGVYSTVVVGHTHQRCYLFLPIPKVSRGRYINSGSWTKDHKPTYAWVSNDGDPRDWRGVRDYPTT